MDYVFKMYMSWVKLFQALLVMLSLAVTKSVHVLSGCIHHQWPKGLVPYFSMAVSTGRLRKSLVLD